MKFFSLILIILLSFAGPGGLAEAKDARPGMCQLSMAYEDQLHTMADFEKGAPKGRIAILSGNCEGEVSYMMIVTYYGGYRTVFLDDSRIRKIRHVQVGEVLQGKKAGMYLKIIRSLWYGLDREGKVIAFAEDKEAAGNKDISLQVESVISIHGALVMEKEDGMHGSRDEMELLAGTWSIPDYQIVVDDEWMGYVRPDISFVRSERRA